MPLFWRGHPASLALSKHATSVPRHASVNGVARESRDDSHHTEKPPREAQAFVDAQHSIAILAYPIAFDNEPAARISRIHAMPSIALRTDNALHGRETEMADLIVLQHELGVGGAEHALGIEEDDGTAPFENGALSTQSTKKLSWLPLALQPATIRW